MLTFFAVLLVGMFPYMMLATMPLFCAADWPKRLLRGRIPRLLSLVAPSVDQPQCSSHCLYSKEQVKPEEVIQITLSKEEEEEFIFLPAITNIVY